ncbi:MAG TPA: glycosyltransferase family 2 protein [Cyclobacteriaceae bacterium]
MRRRNDSGAGKGPKVSIGLPTFNGGRKILKAVTSVFNQDYDNLEIIISDNCSDDTDTEEICKSLSQKYPGIIKYIRQPVNRGVCLNYQYVLDNATGDYFMWIADDDTLAHGILKKYVEFLTNNPDYSLVSGQVKYWKGSKLVLIEKDFTMDQASQYMRVISYYFKVTHGAMFYGLMSRSVAQSISLRNRIGDDWHFVASLAFAGKIKNLDETGYNKTFGGVSSTMKNYAKVIGASWFSATFPHATIAIDAMAEIVMLSPQYGKLNLFSRMFLGLMACLSVLVSHYVKVFPFIIGGRIKRFIRRPYDYWMLSAEKVETH